MVAHTVEAFWLYSVTAAPRECSAVQTSDIRHRPCFMSPYLVLPCLVFPCLVLSRYIALHCMVVVITVATRLRQVGLCYAMNRVCAIAHVVVILILFDSNVRLGSNLFLSLCATIRLSFPTLSCSSLHYPALTCLQSCQEEAAGGYCLAAER